MGAVVLISIVIAASALAIATSILLWSFYKQGETEDMKKKGRSHKAEESDETDDIGYGGGRKGENKLEVNVRTRGEPLPYEMMGTMFRTETESETDKESNQVLPIYGRQTYSRAARWNYYTVLDSGVRIPIMMNNRNCTAELGCEELFDDDEINIPDLKSTYKLRLYETSQYRYIPY